MGGDRTRSANRFDAVIVGGGHNGLVAAAFLGRAGLRVALLEARDRLGGPCGTYEFLPGYRTAFSNSPGSLEPRVVQALDLPRFGLRFLRADPTVVQPFPRGCFLGWRDRERLDQQLEAFHPAEASRYHGLLDALQELARSLKVSLFEPSPGLVAMARRLTSASQELLFTRVFFGSLRELLDWAFASEEARAVLGMVALNANLAAPSAPGTAVGLMLRPLSLSSTPASGADDPRRIPLRGSTGLPIGGMGAIIDALEACCLRHGVTIRTGARVVRILHRDGAARGIVTAEGNEVEAPVVVSSVNPRIAFRDLLDDAAVGADIRREVAAAPMRGSAFKIVLALDGLPRYANLPAGLDQGRIAGTQFRIGPSLDYIEDAVLDGLAGRPSRRPIMWGLIPTVTSPGLAPAGRHLLSVNVWHAPYRLRDGTWAGERDRFGRRCIEVLTEFMPDLPDRIVDGRFMSPVELSAELGLVEANITHGDMLPGRLFGPRPHPAAGDYRTPLRGLYLTGAGTWPGGYVTGIPGVNTSRAVLADLRSGAPREGAKGAWSSW